MNFQLKDNQMALFFMQTTNVHLGLAQRNKCIQFSLRHPRFFVELVSSKYPLTKTLMFKYKDVLDWDLVSSNTNIQWTFELLTSINKYISWDYLTINECAFKDLSLLDSFAKQIIWSRNDDYNDWNIAKNEGLPWTLNFIKKYETLLDFEELSSNRGVKWTETLINKYSERLDLNKLGQNGSVPWTLELFDRYLGKRYLKNFLVQSNYTLISNVDLVEKYKKSLYWSCVSSNDRLPWVDQHLLERWSDFIDWSGISSNKTLFQNDPDFFQMHMEKWSRENYKNFIRLSDNEGLNWSKEFINRYTELWSWENLCTNKSIKWDIQLVDYFYDKIRWGGLKDAPLEDQNGNIVAPTGGGTLVEGMVLNPSVEWTIDFLERYESSLDLEILRHNEGVWQKVFEPVMDDWFVDVVMRII